MIENDAGGFLQNLITASMIDHLLLAEGRGDGGCGEWDLDNEPSRSNKTFLVYSEHLYITQKCFNQVLFSVNICCLHI